MVTLGDVSSLDLFRYPVIYNGSIYFFTNMRALKDACDKNPELVNSGTLNGVPLFKILYSVESRLEITNNKDFNVEPEIYLLEQYYGGKGYDLTKYDKYTAGDVLITNPISYWNSTFFDLRNLNLYEIKCLLSYTDAKGDNLLKGVKGIGPDRINKILKLIPLYDEQLLRQYEEYYEEVYGWVSTDFDLFGRNRDEKQLLVEESIKDIVEYLLDNTKEELVWGKLSDSQRMRLSSAIGNRNPIRKNLVRLIANYVTLTELKNGITDTDTLSRFIRR